MDSASVIAPMVSNCTVISINRLQEYNDASNIHNSSCCGCVESRSKRDACIITDNVLDSQISVLALSDSNAKPNNARRAGSNRTAFSSGNANIAPTIVRMIPASINISLSAGARIIAMLATALHASTWTSTKSLFPCIVSKISNTTSGVPRNDL